MAREPSQRIGSALSPFNIPLTGSESQTAITGDGTWDELSITASSWNATYQSIAYYTTVAEDAEETLLITILAYNNVRDSVWARSGNSEQLETDIVAAAGEDYENPEIPGWSEDYPYYSSTPVGAYDAKPGTPLTMYVPAGGVVPPPEPDGHVAIEQPDGTIIELYACIALSSGQLVCSNFVVYDITDKIDGRRNGVRASMIPNAAGPITQRDVDRVEASQPIDHALSMIIPETFLANHLAPEYPAIAHDSAGSDGNGNVRMGDRLILPPGFDESGSNSVIGEAMVVAARDYGVYVTDRGGGGITMHIEISADDAEGHLQSWANNLQLDLNDIRDNAVIGEAAQEDSAALLVYDTFETGSADAWWDIADGTVESGSIINGVYSYRCNGDEDLDNSNDLGGAFYRFKYQFLVDSGTVPTSGHTVKCFLAINGADHVSGWLSYTGTTLSLGMNAIAGTKKETLAINFDQVYEIQVVIDCTNEDYGFFVDGALIDSGDPVYATLPRIILANAGYNNTSFDQYYDDIEIRSDSTIVVSAVNSTSVADNLTMAFSAGTITVQDATCANVVDNLTMAFSAGEATVADAASASTVDNLTMVFDAGIITVQDSVSASTIDNLTMVFIAISGITRIAMKMSTILRR